MNNEPITHHDKIGFVVLLRAFAVILVMWDHFMAHSLDLNYKASPLLLRIQDFINTPLAIKTDFGFFGVVLFFLISGFIISHVAQKDSMLQFAVKRFLRIYPPLLAALIFIIVIESVYKHFIGTDPFFYNFNLVDFILQFSLVNYFFTSNHVSINAVTWTLSIEILFYLLCFIFLIFLKRKPAIASFLIASICLVIIIICRNHGDKFFIFAATVAYIPYLLMGQVLYLLYSKKINIYSFFALSTLNYFIIVFGIRRIHTAFYWPDNSYGVSFAYAYLIFVIFMLLNDKVKVPRFIAFISETSYSIYLNHLVLGLISMALITPLVGFVPSVIITFFITLGVSYLSNKYIEKPSIKLARVITNPAQRTTKIPSKPM